MTFVILASNGGFLQTTVILGNGLILASRGEVTWLGSGWQRRWDGGGCPAGLPCPRSRIASP